MNIDSVSFGSPPVLEWYGDGKYWLVAEPFKAWIITDQPKPLVITVPAVFKTDLASVPRPLWSLLPPEGGYIPAAVLHDYLCVVKGKLPDGWFQYSKADADRIFLLAMDNQGVSLGIRRIFWAAVRVFGKGW